MGKPTEVTLSYTGKHLQLTHNYRSFGKAERRTSLRFLTILRVGRISNSRDSGLCRVQNLSDTGMMLTTGLPLGVGEHVLVALSDSISLAGKVVWALGERIGVQFGQQIDAGALLQMLAAEQRTGTQRAPRLPTDTVAVAHTDQGTRVVRVLNISQQGMGVAHDGSLVEGATLKVVLPNGIERQAVVRWSYDHKAGLRLLDPIPCDKLGSAKDL